MKLDADWKVGKTFQVIELLYEMTILHFKDFRRALYGGCNYRLFGNKKTFAILKNNWRKLSEEEKVAKFDAFVKHNYRKKKEYVKSSCTNFQVIKTSTARKPGQRKRVRSTKTICKN